MYVVDIHISSPFTNFSTFSLVVHHMTKILLLFHFALIIKGMSFQIYTQKEEKYRETNSFKVVLKKKKWRKTGINEKILCEKLYCFSSFLFSPTVFLQVPRLKSNFVCNDFLWSRWERAMVVGGIKANGRKMEEMTENFLKILDDKWLAVKSLKVKLWNSISLCTVLHRVDRSTKKWSQLLWASQCVSESRVEGERKMKANNGTRTKNQIGYSQLSTLLRKNIYPFQSTGINFANQKR